jgi:hypothetical protein
MDRDGSPAPKWNPTYDAWIARVANPLFGEISVMLQTGGEHELPSSEQLAILQTLRTINASIRSDIAAAAKKYADSWVGLDQLDYLSEADFDLDLRNSGGVVPATYENGKAYAIVHGRSEIDPEHGLACVFDSAGRFGITHADFCLSPPGPDEYHELENALPEEEHGELLWAVAKQPHDF